MRAAVVAVALVVSAPVLAAPPPQLDKPFTVTRGEYAALACQSVLDTAIMVGEGQATHGLFDRHQNDHVAVLYSSQHHQLVFMVVGRSRTIDDAKARLDVVRKKVLPQIFSMLSSGYGIKVGPTEYRLVFENVLKGKMQAVVEWVNGQYVLPS